MKTTKQAALTDLQIEIFIRQEFPDDFKEEHELVFDGKTVRLTHFDRLYIEQRQNFGTAKVDFIFRTGCVFAYYLSWNDNRNRWIEIPTHWRAKTVYQPVISGIIRDVLEYPAQGIIDNLKRVEANLLCLREYRGDLSLDKLRELMRKEKMFLFALM